MSDIRERMSPLIAPSVVFLTLAAWGCQETGDSEHAAAEDPVVEVEAPEASQAEPVRTPAFRRWDFSRWMYGISAFRTEQATADRVPAVWNPPTAGFNSGSLRVSASDAKASVELLLLRAEKVQNGRVSTTVTAFEMHGAPKYTKDIPVSEYWPDNPAGGGLVWRADGFKDGYLALCDLRNGDVGVYKMTAGSPKLIEETDLELKKGVTDARYCDLEVVFVGSRFVVKDDGKEVLVVEDATYTSAGEVGLVAYGASEPEFSDFVLEVY